MGLYGRGGPRVRLTGKFYRADAGYAYTGMASRSDLAGSLHAKLGVSPGIPGLQGVHSFRGSVPVGCNGFPPSAGSAAPDSTGPPLHLPNTSAQYHAMIVGRSAGGSWIPLRHKFRQGGTTARSSALHASIVRGSRCRPGRISPEPPDYLWARWHPTIHPGSPPNGRAGEQARPVTLE